MEILKMYPYIQENQLESPCRYTYTSFFGKEFLQAYLRSRSLILSSCDATKLVSADDCMSRFKHAYKRYSTPLPDPNKMMYRQIIYIIDFIECLRDLFALKSVNAQHIDCLNRLIQRFEVSKRLYTSYQSNLTKGSGDYKTLNNYFQFGFLLSFAYMETSNLQYLNSLLKVNDLLLSTNDTSKLACPATRLEFEDLIKLELSLVNNLSPFSTW